MPLGMVVFEKANTPISAYQSWRIGRNPFPISGTVLPCLPISRWRADDGIRWLEINPLQCSRSLKFVN